MSSIHTKMKIWCFAALLLGLFNLFNLVFFFSNMYVFESFDPFSKEHSNVMLLLVFILFMGSSVAVTQADNRKVNIWTLLTTLFASLTLSIWLLVSSDLRRNQLQHLLSMKPRDASEATNSGMLDAETFHFLYSSFSERFERYRCREYPQQNITVDDWCKAPNDVVMDTQSYEYLGDTICHAMEPWRYNNLGRQTAGESNRKAKWFYEQISHKRWNQKECSDIGNTYFYATETWRRIPLEEERHFCGMCANIFRKVKELSKKKNHETLCASKDKNDVECHFYKDLSKKLFAHYELEHKVFVEHFGDVNRNNLKKQKRIQARLRKWATNMNVIKHLFPNEDNTNNNDVLLNYIDIYGGERNRNGVKLDQKSRTTHASRPYIWVKNKYGDNFHKFTPLEGGVIVENEQYLMRAVWSAVNSKAREDWNFLLSAVKQPTKYGRTLIDSINHRFADLVTDDPSTRLPANLTLDNRVYHANGLSKGHIDLDRIDGADFLPTGEHVEVFFRTPSDSDNSPGVTVIWSKEGDMLKQYPWLKRYWFEDNDVDLQYAMIFEQRGNIVKVLPGASVNGGYSESKCKEEAPPPDLPSGLQYTACRDCGMRVPDGKPHFCRVVSSASQGVTLMVPTILEINMSEGNSHLPTSPYTFVNMKHYLNDRDSVLLRNEGRIVDGPSDPDFPNVKHRVFCQSFMRFAREYADYVTVWIILSMLLVVLHIVLIVGSCAQYKYYAAEYREEMESQ